jgi:hypothetical protein
MVLQAAETLNYKAAGMAEILDILAQGEWSRVALISGICCKCFENLETLLKARRKEERGWTDRLKANVARTERHNQSAYLGPNRGLVFRNAKGYCGIDNETHKLVLCRESSRANVLEIWGLETMT